MPAITTPTEDQIAAIAAGNGAPSWERKYFPGFVEGPLGFPLAEACAKYLEHVLKDQPKDSEFEYRKSIITKAPESFVEGERADVSVLSNMEIDRDYEVVIPKGINLEQYRKNPTVLFGHNYCMAPIGKAAWIKAMGSGMDSILKAKTIYAAPPPNHIGNWWIDEIYHLIKTGFLPGKSIGFLPRKMHSPTPDEIKKRPALAECFRIIDEAIMFEYSVVGIPANQNALVEAVAKGTVSESIIKTLGIELRVKKDADPPASPSPDSSVDSSTGNNDEPTDDPEFLEFKASKEDFLAWKAAKSKATTPAPAPSPVAPPPVTSPAPETKKPDLIPIAFVSRKSIEASVLQAFSGIDIAEKIEEIVQDRIDIARGRI